MDSVPAWLRRLGLERYVQIFADNDVDLEAIRLLGESDLEKLGVSLGHRKRLLKAIAELDGVAASAAQLTVAPTGSRASDTEAAPAVITTEAGERRQLTVLFCDMVGFTELANRVDPEVLQRIIRSYEDACAVCITRYEGYVFQRLSDGIVAFFGYPLAHEGEAERAIHAGLEIIEALSKLDVPDAGPLAVRIGAISMTPQKHKDETLRSLVDLTEAAARKQPSVMLFEDEHWADPTTLEVLDLLIDRVKAVPLLIVLTHRPEFQSRWSEQGHVSALNLSKLTRPHCATIVSRLASGKALPAALLEQILTKTDGVPLFLEELTKSILESDELQEASYGRTESPARAAPSCRRRSNTTNVHATSVRSRSQRALARWIPSNPLS